MKYARIFFWKSIKRKKNSHLLTTLLSSVFYKKTLEVNSVFVQKYEIMQLYDQIYNESIDDAYCRLSYLSNYVSVTAFPEDPFGRVSSLCSVCWLGRNLKLDLKSNLNPKFVVLHLILYEKIPLKRSFLSIRCC